MDSLRWHAVKPMAATNPMHTTAYPPRLTMVERTRHSSLYVDCKVRQPVCPQSHEYGSHYGNTQNKRSVSQRIRGHCDHHRWDCALSLVEPECSRQLARGRREMALASGMSRAHLRTPSSSGLSASRLKVSQRSGRGRLHIRSESAMASGRLSRRLGAARPDYGLSARNRQAASSVRCTPACRSVARPVTTVSTVTMHVKSGPGKKGRALRGHAADR